MTDEHPVRDALRAGLQVILVLAALVVVGYLAFRGFEALGLLDPPFRPDPPPTFPG